MASTAKNVSELKSAGVEKLSSDVEALKKDIAGLVSTLRDLGQDGSATALMETKKRAALLQDEAREKVESLQTTADQLSVQAKEVVQEKPVTALIVAATVGMVFGFMTARK